jgi:hypothetical protein
MSDREILSYLKHKSEKTCGRFRADQLKTYSHEAPLKLNTGLILLKAGLISLFLMLLSKQNFAQNIDTKTKSEIVQQQGQTSEKTTTATTEQKIKGLVISDEDQTPLPGVNIYLKGTSEGIAADENGQFEFPKKLKEGDILIFSFVGFETQEYVIRKEMSNKIEIHMLSAALEMMGAVAVDEIYESDQTRLNKVWRKVKSIF